MRPYRNLKIASLIERELSQLLLKNLDLEGAIITIIGVEVSGDLLQAKVKVGILPESKTGEVFALLTNRRGELQHKLLRKMNIRPMPQIKFEIEKSEMMTT